MSRPGAARLAGGGVHEQPRIAEVSLGFLARSALHPHEDLRRLGFQPTDETAQGRIAAPIAPFPQPL